MTTRASNIARHRAEVSKTNSLAVIAKAVSENAGGMGRQAAVIAAASGLVLTSGIAANAAENNVQRESTSTSAQEVHAASSVKVVAAQKTIAFEKVRSSSVAKPAPVAAPVAAAPAVEATPAAQVQAEATAVTPVAATTEEAPAAQQTAAAPAAATAAPAATSTASASGQGAAIAAAAYAQLGVAQDCTALATNALKAVGINYHGWPAGYLSLGRTVSAAEAQPGDLVYYADGGAGLAHIAVYVGNGQAVHGGWNGFTTALFSVNVGSGPVYIRVGG
ncbi:NlpC/P60 family protein [Pseudarthrobacter sp. J1763]|uniref:NlpC/P60 family protein n=1 Tax=Pseudarthrobacter sp. J1763 TaxID=3420445 RepID=UPI003D2B8310